VAVGRNGTILRSDCGSGPPLCQGTALNLDTPKLITGTESLGSQVSITTTNSYQVQAGGNLTFTAPKISLGPGFRVALGGLFHATPQACAP
jgi:hypothetical protein